MSREGRDTLWLLALLACSMAPHARRLPLWCALGAAAALLWRAKLAWSDGAHPPRWVVWLCLLLSVGLTWHSHHTLMGREAGVTLVTVLAGLKTLELRAQRDAFVVTSLGFFLILTQFLYDQSPWMALTMLGVVLGLLSSLVLAQRPLGRPALAQALGEATRLVAWGLPLMLALYVFFPRLGPLWSLPLDAGQARSGLSNELRLGHLAQVSLDDSIAMRLAFVGEPPPPEQRYFRGPVLDQFDGWRWTPSPQSPATVAKHSTDGPDAQVLAVQGPWYDYTATLEGSRLEALPLLEGSLQASLLEGDAGASLQRQGLDWRLHPASGQRVRIRARAAAKVQMGPAQDAVGLREWVALPTGHNPRTLSWALALRSQPRWQSATAHALSAHLLEHIRQNGFRYTLEPEDEAPQIDPQGRGDPHAIDRFWLDRRSGFCEHFAAAYVVVMRAMDVPARVVTGYQGAERNAVDGLYVVRQSDAHAWAEYWQAGEGWIRVDPTAAVAPERVDRRQLRLGTQQGAAGLLRSLAPEWMNPARAWMEAANHRWNSWVLQYTRDSQSRWLGQWMGEAVSPTDLARWSWGSLASSSLVGALILWWQRPRTPLTAWQRTLSKVHAQLVRAGLSEPAGLMRPAPALAWRMQLLRTPAAALPGCDRMGAAATLSALDALRYGPAPHGQVHPPFPRQAVRSLMRQLAAQCPPAQRPG